MTLIGFSFFPLLSVFWQRLLPNQLIKAQCQPRSQGSSTTILLFSTTTTTQILLFSLLLLLLLLTINVSNNLKVSKLDFPSKRIAGVTLGCQEKERFYFVHVIDCSNQALKSLGKRRQVNCFHCTRVTIISKPRHLLVCRNPLFSRESCVCKEGNHLHR